MSFGFGFIWSRWTNTYRSRSIRLQSYNSGCTDESASNFNPDATVDDGSCSYPPVLSNQCTEQDILILDSPNETFPGQDNSNIMLDVFGTVFLEEPQEMVLNGVLLMLADGEKRLAMVAMDVMEILVLAWIVIA